MFTALHYDSIDSTNLEARRLIISGELTAPSLLCADRQIMGKGSRGREWISETGNLYTSFVLPLKINDDRALAVYPIALAVQKMIQNMVPAEDVLIKWPNDILINERKVAGMLHELCSHDHTTYFIAGIGINIAHHPASTTNFPATHIQEYHPLTKTLTDLAKELGAWLEKELNNWRANGIKIIYEELYPRFYHLGREIKVTLHHAPEDPLYGIFEGLNKAGGLILAQGDQKHVVYAGDIFPSLARSSCQ